MSKYPRQSSEHRVQKGTLNLTRKRREFMTRSHVRSQPVPRIERLIGENGPVPPFPSSRDKMPQQRQVRRSHTKRARSQLTLGNGPVSHTHPTWYVHDTVIALTTSLRSGPVVDTPTQFQRIKCARLYQVPWKAMKAERIQKGE